MRSLARVPAALLLCMCACAPTTTAPLVRAAPPPAPAVQPLATPALSIPAALDFAAQAVLDHVNALAGTIGPRPAGSAGARAGADYIAAQLAGYGLAVERQPFTFPHFAERRAELSLAGSGDALAPVHSMLYSAAGDVSGRLVTAGFGRPEDFPRDGMAGAVALMQRGADVTFKDKADRAAAAGAAAAIIVNSAAHEFTGSLQVPSPIPVLAVSGDAWTALADLAARGATVHVVVDASVEEVVTENVIGTFGSGAKQILLGAHYDSVEIGPGANDNASGTATIIELARVLAAAPLQARVTVVAFSAEELGLLGSAHYVQQLPEQERRGITAMLNFDMVGVGDTPSIGGDPQLVQAAQTAADLRGWSLTQLDRSFLQRSDQGPFIGAGIPAIFFNVEDDPDYHTPSDLPRNLSAARVDQIGQVALSVIRELAG